MNFIIEDLDENHLFVDSTQVEKLKQLVNENLSQNIFKSTLTHE